MDGSASALACLLPARIALIFSSAAANWAAAFAPFSAFAVAAASSSLSFLKSSAAFAASAFALSAAAFAAAAAAAAACCSALCPVAAVAEPAPEPEPDPEEDPEAPEDEPDAPDPEAPDDEPDAPDPEAPDDDPDAPEDEPEDPEPELEPDDPEDVPEPPAIKALKVFVASWTVALTDADTWLSLFFSACRVVFSAGLHLTLVGVAASPVARAKTLARSLFAAAAVRPPILARTSAHDVDGSWSALACLLAARRASTVLSASASLAMAAFPLSMVA